MFIPLYFCIILHFSTSINIFVFKIVNVTISALTLHNKYRNKYISMGENPFIK